MSEPAILTCALTGVLTNPKQYPVPVTPAQMAAMLATVPQGRLGSPEDCVGAFLFLASAALSPYIIGQVIEVNGGQLMP